MSRLLIAGLSACLWCSCGAADDSESVADGALRAADPLNLILISLDTMRADRLSQYGRIERETTPVLDRLAAESALFEDCLSASTVTGPSHLSMFTGQYPTRHGLLQNGARVNPLGTLASVLRDAGWNTAGFTGGGFLRDLFGLGFGFETYRARGGPLAQFKRTLATSLPHALEWLKSRPDGPFFLFLHGYDPHCPYEAAPQALHGIGAPAAAVFDPRGKCGEEHYLPLLQDESFGSDDLDYLTDLYDALVHSADESLKPLIFYLRKSGLLDRTILVFTSDHGEGLGEHDWIGHGRLWDEQARVPLFIRFPGGRWSGRFEQPVSLVDLYPTLLDALGVELPGDELSASLEGRNLMPLLRGEPSAADWAPDRLRVVSFADERAVLLGTRWKLTFRLVDGEPAEFRLFDLLTDPGELQDLAGTPESAPQLTAMLARVKAWRLHTADLNRRWRVVAGEPELEPEAAAELSGLGYGGEK